MVKMIAGRKYNIQPIRGENYDDCEFRFGELTITAKDGQYFQTIFTSHSELNKTELNKTWWDSEGFKITEIE